MSEVQWTGFLVERPAQGSGVQWVGETAPAPQKLAPQALGDQPADPGTFTVQTDEFKFTLGGPKLVQLGAPNESQAATSDWSGIWSLLSLVGMGLSAYHGYARNKSVGWGIGWGVAGAVAPIITVPIALAQGFAKPAGARANPRLVTSQETEASRRKVRAAATVKFGRGKANIFFEHGQWFAEVNGRYWSAVDAYPGIAHGVDFERID